MPENACVFQQSRSLAVPLSRCLAVPQSRGLVVSWSRSLVVSLSRRLVVPLSRRLAVPPSRWRASQPFLGVLSLSQSFPSNRAPLSPPQSLSPIPKSLSIVADYFVNF